MIGEGRLCYTDPRCCTGRIYYSDSRWIRNTETAGAFDHNEQGGHCNPIEKSGIHLDKQGLRDGRIIFLHVTQIITPTRPNKVIERTARTFFFLPENAYVRIIRMTEDTTDASVNNSF